MNTIEISTPYITLGQLLKHIGAIDTGGQVKAFLSEYQITVNGEQEERRGRKLYPGDTLSIETMGNYEIVEES